MAISHILLLCVFFAFSDHGYHRDKQSSKAFCSHVLQVSCWGRKDFFSSVLLVLDMTCSALSPYSATKKMKKSFFPPLSNPAKAETETPEASMSSSLVFNYQNKQKGKM